MDVSLEPDFRMTLLAGGIAADGSVLAMSLDALRAAAAEWPATAGTPQPIADMLAVSRRLFEHSYFVYEFLVVGSVWSLMALEAALRHRFGESPRDGLAVLVRRAADAGVVDPDLATALDAGRQLRNRLVHARGQAVYTVGMASGIMLTSHRVVAALFP